jgi:hypothetical protein
LRILVDSKPSQSSPTQPGRGIRRVADLYNNLTDLLNKARTHSTINGLSRAGIEEMERNDFKGMSEDAIEELRKE